MKASVVFIATYDTKGVETDYIKQEIEKNGVNCTTIDVGVGGQPLGHPDISLEKLCEGTQYTVAGIHKLSRGEAVEIASNLVEKKILEMFNNKEMDAIIGIGGAGGTQIVTQAMRKLPVGIPKIMMSTLASGNVSWYLEDSDIMMMPSVCDVAGINCITKMVFNRLAALAAKSAQWYQTEAQQFDALYEDSTVRRLSMTMYGTTTKGVTNARNELDRHGYETIVFHASGAGGRSMEKFVRRGIIHGVVDMTIAEIGGHLIGGNHDAGPGRLDAMMEMGIPLLLVPGAADTIVLPPMKDLPDKFRQGRILNYHNPTMTTMRTNTEENIAIGQFIVRKLKAATGPVKLLIPLGGLSSIDMPGKIFYLPEANQALFDTLKTGLAGTGIEIMEDRRHIDEDGFGQQAAKVMHDMMQSHD